MRVKMTAWHGTSEMDLEDALRPKGYGAEGAAERAQDQADANARAIGRLAALLVERRLISTEEAFEACGISDDWEEVEP